MKILMKILAIVLATSILFSGALLEVMAEKATIPEINDSDISDLMNAHKVNPLTGNETEPFNTAGSSVLMSKENELLLYTSNKKGVSVKDDFVIVFEQMDQNTSYAGEGNVSPELDLFFVTAVALDASGNGTGDHIAYLGVKAFDDNDGGVNAGRTGEQALMLVLYNARRGSVVDTMELGSVKDWVNNVDHWAYKTFFSVTAGDYDHDGVDEIACTDHNMGVQLIEIAKDTSGLSLETAKHYQWTDLVSESVAEKMKKAVTANGEINRRVLISLTTGNFDGTGAEELAAAVSTNRPTDELLPDIPEAYTTQLAMLKTPLSDSVNIRTLVVHTTEASEDEEEQDNVVHRVIYAGQIAAGDMDGDRRDEIVIVGYTGKMEITAKGKILYGQYEYDKKNIALTYAKLDGTWFGIPSTTVDKMTPFIEEGFFANNDLLVPLSVGTAKLHGQYGKASVFMGGKVYQFSNEQATVLYTHAFFEKESSFLITDAYVEHVTSGVFGGADSFNNGKPMINEQFIFTVVEKDNSQNEYSYKVGFISMSTNQATGLTNFSDNTTTMNRDGYLLEERPGGLKSNSGKSDTNYGTALVPVAVDIDDDGLLVKHTNTTYFYEDPSVEVILQAAPYFDELGNWNEFNGSTTYSVSVSRSLIDIFGYTHSIHAGFKGKMDFDKAGELELKVGYALDMDFEHEIAYTTTYTTTFEAGSYDTVVVQRTPYVCYEYSYVDINGNLLTGEDAGCVMFMEAMHPVYFQLSVDEYNQFADAYNAMADKHDNEGKTSDGASVESVGDSYRLVKITDEILPADTTGNPENYYSTIRGGEYISQGTCALGTNGGFTSSEFSYEVEQSYSAVYAHGLHFELEGVAMVGAGVFGAGAFAALSFQETCGYGNATINGTATGGTVANIIPSNYSQIEQETLKLYGFNWRCAMWKKSMMTDVNGNPYLDSNGNVIQIPIVGYVVTNVKSPMSAPTGVEAYLSGNGYQVTVDWIPFPATSDTLIGYYIYRTCDNQDPVQINNAPLTAAASSFVDSSILKPGKIYTYYVAACYNDGFTEYLTMNSKSSTVVWGIPQVAENVTNDSDRHVASLFGNGSMPVIVTMGAVGIAAASLWIAVAYRKNKIAVNPDDEED